MGQQEVLTVHVFSVLSCYIKQFLYEIFVMSGIMKVEVRVISRSITLTKTLIILYITKTESNKTAVTNMSSHRGSFYSALVSR